MAHDEKHEEVCYNPSLFYKKPGQLKCEEGILSVKHPSAALLREPQTGTDAGDYVW